MSKQNTGNNLIANFATTNSILPAKIGVDISIGDFLVFNKNDNTVVPFDYNVAGINDSVFNIEANFIGVAIQTNSAGNIQAGYEAFPQENFYGITVATEMMYLANCDSATWQFGELVQAVVGNPNKVAKCTDQNLAIGYVAGDYTVSATSRVRVRLISGKYSPYTNQNLQGPVSLSIGSGNIVSGMLGNGSVVSGSVASGQIGINHLASGTVAGAFGPSSITSGFIASGNVSNFHLSSGAAIGNLQSGSIGSGLLANNSVLNGSIGSGQVSLFKINAATTTYTAASGLLAGQSLTYDGAGMTWQDADHLMLTVRNNTGVTMPKGSVVYISGGLGSQALVTLASAANDPSSSKTLGILQDDIPDNDTGRCLVEGLLHNVDTNAYPVGTLLYLSTTAGGWTTTKYQAPVGHIVYIGTVVRQNINNGVVAVKIQNGYELEELHDVRVLSGSLQSGHVLQYNTLSGGYWENVYPNVNSGYVSNNSIFSGNIASGQIGSFHLSSGAVTSGDIGNAAVVSGSIAAAVIGTPHIANAAIVSGLLGSGQVGRFHISSGAVVKQLTQGTNITITADANDNYTINSTGGGGGGTAAVDLPNQFRLSVTSGVAIDSNVTSGATLIHLVPFIGNKIALFSGSTWGNVYSSGAVNISAVTLASGQIYDIFAFNNAGVPALEYSAAWSTGITSGGAGPITSTRTDGISFVNGIPVKSSDNTRRLVGTVMGTISGRTAMTDTTKGVTNYDNQVPLKIDMRKVNNHAYIQANASGIGAAQIWATDITTLCRWVSPIDGTVGQMGLQTQLARETGTGFVGIGFFGNCINSGVMFPLDSASNIRSSFRPPMVKSAVSGDGLEAASGPCPITNKAGYNFIYPEEFCTASGALRSYTLEVAGTITG